MFEGARSLNVTPQIGHFNKKALQRAQKMRESDPAGDYLYGLCIAAMTMHENSYQLEESLDAVREHLKRIEASGNTHRSQPPDMDAFFGKSIWFCLEQIAGEGKINICLAALSLIEADWTAVESRAYDYGYVIAKPTALDAACIQHEVLYGFRAPG